MFCSGAGLRWVDEGPRPGVTTTTEVPGVRTEPARGLAALLAIACGITVGAGVYQDQSELAPALFAGVIALIVARAILNWGPIQAVLRGALWLLKVAIVLGLIVGALALIAN